MTNKASKYTGERIPFQTPLLKAGEMLNGYWINSTLITVHLKLKYLYLVWTRAYFSLKLM